MKKATRQFLTLLMLLAAPGVVALLFLSGEPGPTDPPALPAVISTLFGIIALAFAVTAPREQESKDPGSTEGWAWGWAPTLAVLALTVTGLGLRVAYLDKFWLSNDEAFFVFAAGHESIGDAMRESLQHFHPPTNFVMLHYLLKVSWDPVWIRLGSIVGGTLAIPCTYLLVRSLFGRLAGLVAATLVTFSPNLILLSQVCRNYSPSLPFFLLSLYFLARYVRERRESLLYGFALFELISVCWLYGYLPAFLGANLVLFGVLAKQARPLRGMARAVLAQIPVGVVYIVALLLHKPRTDVRTQIAIVNYMKDEFNLDPTNPMKPIIGIIQYLTSGGWEATSFFIALGLLVAILLTGLSLWRVQLRRELAFCLATFPFAYVFAFWLQLLPFGGTRHSFYAFPFIFALIGAAASLMVLGNRQFAAAAGSAPAEAGEQEGGARGRRLSRRAAAVVLALLSTGFVWNSLRSHLDTSPYLLRRSPLFREDIVFYRADAYKAVELPTRIEDINEVSQYLLARSHPGEIVVTALPSFMILRGRLAPPPHEVFYDPLAPQEFVWQGRRFVYVRGSGLGFMPNSLVMTIARLARDEGLGYDERVWVAHAGWDVWSRSLRDWTRGGFPGTVVEFGEWSSVDEMVFPIRTGITRHYAEREYGLDRNRAPASWPRRQVGGFEELP
jgi:hypothetical protein